MIRRGRSVINRAGIAGLYGQKPSAFHGGRNTAPWDHSEHPTPVNRDPFATEDQLGTAPRTWLYDEKQAIAFAQGKKVPALPTTDHPGDLLTERDAAKWLGVTLFTFRERVKSLRIPDPDERPFKVNHWFRRTLAEAEKPRRGAPARSAEEPAPRQRMKAVVEALPDGEQIRFVVLAREAQVSRTTARQFLREPRLRAIATFGGTVGPDLENWDNFLADLRTLAARKKYSGISIEITEK